MANTEAAANAQVVTRNADRDWWISAEKGAAVTGKGNDDKAFEIYQSDVTVSSGAGDDYVLIEDATGVEVNAGAGDDFIIWDQASGKTTLGSGNDTLYLSYGATGVEVADYSYAHDTIKVSDETYLLAKPEVQGGTLVLSPSANSGDDTVSVTLNALKGSRDGYAAKLVSPAWEEESGTVHAKQTRSYAWIGAEDGSIDLRHLEGDFVVLADAYQSASVIGGAGNDTIYAGDGASVYGGKGNNLVSLSEADDAVVFYSGTGRDTVTGYRADDGQIIDFFGGAATGFARTTLTGGNGSVKVKAGTTNSITIMTEDDVDTALIYATGTNVGLTQQVKIGMTKEDNDFTYDADVKNYIGGNKTDTIGLCQEFCVNFSS